MSSGNGFPTTSKCTKTIRINNLRVKRSSCDTVLYLLSMARRRFALCFRACVSCLNPFNLIFRWVGRSLQVLELRTINTRSKGRSGSSEVPRNPLTRWDVSSIPANGIFLTKKLKTKIKMLNGWRTIKSLVHKIRLHGRRGKGMAECFSRGKLRHAPQKEGGLEILCDLPPV